MVVAHVSLPTGQKNFDAMKAFYAASLAPLGYSVFMEHAGVIGFRQPRSGPDFWLHSGGTEFAAFDGNLDKRGGKTHVAFEAQSVAQVEQWHAAAMYAFGETVTILTAGRKAGGVDNGKPGERAHYVKGYHAAYVIDPLGNNIEVMHYQPLWLQAAKASPYVVTAVLGAALAYVGSLVQSGALDGVVSRFTQ